MRKRAREKLAEGRILLGIPSGSRPKPAKQEAEAESSAAATQGKSKMREDEKQIRKLQLEKRENLAQIEKLKETIAHKEIEIGIHHVVVDIIKNVYTCPLCLEIMVDPHVLAPCGHSACINCTYEHFRRANSCFPNDFESELTTGRKNEKDSDIRQRTKVCFMCRSPVRLRPIPIFLGKELVQNLQAAHPPRSKPIKYKPKEVKVLRRPTPDMWRYTFLQNDEKPGYYDKEDDVFRCGCGAEVVDQRCTDGCLGTFDPRPSAEARQPQVPEQARDETALIMEVVRLRRVRESAGGTHPLRPTANEVETSHIQPDLRATLSEIKIGDMTMDAPAAVRRVLNPPADFVDEDGSDVESDDDDEERLSFIEYSDENSHEESDSEGDEEEEEREPGRGVKRRRVVLDSDASDSDYHGAGDASAPIEVGDSDSEAISDDFVPRSPPRSNLAGSSFSRRIIIDSDED